MPDRRLLAVFLLLDAAMIAIGVLIAITCSEEFLRGVVCGLLFVPVSRGVIRDVRRWRRERDA